LTPRRRPEERTLPKEPPLNSVHDITVTFEEGANRRTGAADSGDAPRHESGDGQERGRQYDCDARIERNRWRGTALTDRTRSAHRCDHDNDEAAMPDNHIVIIPGLSAPD
jgi:hypothetical protein